jgi:replicative DNA helicase
MEIETELSMFPTALNTWKINNGYEYIETAIEMTIDNLYNIDLYYDSVRKYSILRNAVEKMKMDISFIYDETNETLMRLFNEMNSNQVLSTIYNKFDEFKNLWKNSFGDNYSFHAGDNITNVIEDCKNQDNTFGYPFQSGIMTTIFRGMRPKKFMIRSSVSGGGKSRNSLAEACNIASDKLYDWTKQKWLSTGTKLPVLFISTELMQEEIQTCLLAHISGIEEDRLTEWKDITPEEELIILESGKIVEESLLYGEYVPDFTITIIEELIERHIINHNITHCFFDYINDSPSLYSFYIQKTGIKLQTHQILFLFSAALKHLANKYNIFIGSSTQLNSSYKSEKDGNALKGSKAILEKTDHGVLALPVTSEDLKKLKPILDTHFLTIPSMAYYIIKNRGGKWKAIIVWTKINLGTVREMDCFTTNTDFELITNLEPTLLEFQFDDIGECEPIVNESSANEYIEEFNKIQIDD